MKNIIPDIDLQNYIECGRVVESRDYYKGKSFNFAGNWAPGITYYNNEYVQDFVVYKGALLACHRSHTSNNNLEPHLLYDSEDPEKIIGVDSSVWEFVFSGTTGMPGENGQVYVPEYNESTGYITWTLESTPSQVSSMYIKGEREIQAHKVI